MSSAKAASEGRPGEFPVAARQKYLPLIRLLILILCLAAAAIFYAQGQLNHDPSFLLVAARRWLNGATLYRDIMEINPPLIFYLTAPAVLISQMSGISASIVFVVLVCVIAGVSVAWCWNLLVRIEAISLGLRYAIVAACLAALVLTPAYNFGQREHLFIVFTLPYFVAAALSRMGLEPTVREKIALGVFGFFGFALKPYFLIPALFAAIVLSAQKRSLKPLYDPANLSIATGSIAYFIFVAAFHPSYFATVIPLGMSVYDAVANDDTAGIALRSALPAVLIVAMATVRAPTPRIRQTLVALSAVLAGMLLIFVLQRKVWDYQLVPFDSMALVAAVIAIALTGRRVLSSPLHFAAFAVTPVILLTTALQDPHYRNPYPEAFVSRLEQASPNWSGKSVLVLTTNVSAAFPFVNSLGAEWAGRYPYQWLIAGALTRQNLAPCSATEKNCATSAILDYARRTNVDDLVERQPDAVLVDQREMKSYLPDGSFDYIAFLDADPRFHAIWQGYKKVDTVADYDIWLRASGP